MITKFDEEDFKNFESGKNKLARPPKEAYLYLPNGEEVIEFDEKNPTKTLRRIFEGGVCYNEFEKLKLKELKEEIEKYNLSCYKKKTPRLTLPKDWKEYNSLRNLQATGYNIQKTIENLLQHLVWRKENFPLKITNKAMEILNLGFIYFHGRDNRFRPIMIWSPRVFVKHNKDYSFDDWRIAFIFFMEYAINHLLISGQVENWNLICDIKGISLLSIPNDLKKLIQILQQNYRCRLFVFYIVNIGSFVSLLWGIVKKMVDPSAEKKIKMIKELNSKCEMFSHIHPSQVETKYGGTAKDLEFPFFPPKVPSKTFFLEDDAKYSLKKLQISEETYKALIEKNPLMVKSPYIDFNEKWITQSPEEKDEAKVIIDFIDAKNTKEYVMEHEKWNIVEESKICEEKIITTYESLPQRSLNDINNNFFPKNYFFSENVGREKYLESARRVAGILLLINNI
jgi:hypothetical protein